MTSPIISSPHLCKETGSSNASRAATGPQPRIATEAEPSAAMIDAALKVWFGDEHVPVFPALEAERRGMVVRMYLAMREAR